MESTSSTCRGGAHAKNEDFVLRCNHSSGLGRKVCFLADGQGGRPDGDIASRIACEKAAELVADKPWETLMSSSTWDEVFCEADACVRATCDGFASMVGLVCGSNTVFGASVGDCKVYFLNEEEGQLCEITDRQKKNPPVGGGFSYVTSFSVPDFSSGTILMMSDGVWKFAGATAIKAAMEIDDLLDVPDFLKRAVLDKQLSDDFPDDFSLIGIRA